MLNNKVMHFIPFLKPLIILLNHLILELPFLGQIVISELEVSDIFLCYLVVVSLELLSETVVALDSVGG